MSIEDRNSIVDYEEVLRVLSESFQEVWKDNPDVLVYLSDLGSLGLHRLVQEPERLAEEKVSILEQTQDLAFHNYKTFIQAAECSQKIFRDFNIIESRLDSLVNKLPTFKQKCCDFGKEAQQINARWKQASSTLAKHQQLLEFLEMPQLMDNYVKAGYYDEALELSSYVKRLERKHVDIPLIKSIIDDIQSAANVMLTQILAKLQTNIQLPECLKIVGYLRRIDVFNETELRIKFLQARDSWFKKVISEIDNSDPYQHVIKVIENSRIHLFDIITQYRAIFSDDDPMLLVHNSSKSNCAIFHSWMTMKISWFLHTLEKDICLNLGGRIDSVFAQCMYFGLSFSRVNIDFRPLLIPIFQNAVFNKFQSDIEHSTQKFEKTIRLYVFSSFTNTALLVPSLSEDSLQPPNCLLDFQPLAQYCNDVLNALNDLKLCCSYSLSADVIKIITESLGRLVKILIDVYYQRKLSSNELESEHFFRFCFLLSSELIPHLTKCLNVFFSPEDISQVLGISSLDFKKFEYLCKLNSKEIMKPLDIILPCKDDIDESDVGLIMNFKSNDNVTSSDRQTPVELQETKSSSGYSLSGLKEDEISKDNPTENVTVEIENEEPVVDSNMSELISKSDTFNENNATKEISNVDIHDFNLPPSTKYEELSTGQNFVIEDSNENNIVQEDDLINVNINAHGTPPENVGPDTLEKEQDAPVKS